MKTADWQDDDGFDRVDDYKHFGKKAQRWYRRRIWTHLLDFANAHETRTGESISNSELGLLLHRLGWAWGLYVTWRDDDECRGGGWSDENLPELLKEIRAEAALAAIETLDDWLRADLSGSLPPLPDSMRGGGSVEMDADLKCSLAKSARARRRNWPLLCVDCGATFRRQPSARGTPIRCADCLELRKSHDRPVKGNDRGV